MRVILGSNIGQNSLKFSIFIILVDLDRVLANKIQGTHAVSKCTLIKVSGLQSFGHLRHMVKKNSKIELGGVV